MNQTDTDRIIANELDKFRGWLIEIERQSDLEKLRTEVSAKRWQLSQQIIALLPELHDG